MALGSVLAGAPIEQAVSKPIIRINRSALRMRKVNLQSQYTSILP
jgi:hypothetical protein